MNIIHFTNHCLYLGGGERLGFNWISNSKYPSIYYSRAGGINYDATDRFKTYGSDDELTELITRHCNDVIVTHDPMITANPAFAKCARLIWYVHGAFAFDIDVSAMPRPKFVISNYSPTRFHPSWISLPVIPVQLGVDVTQFKQPTRVPKNDRIVIGIVGRISSEKIPMFWFDFLEKFNRVRNNVDLYEFRFYGMNAGSPYSFDFFHRLSKIPNAHYFGAIDKSEIQNVFKNLDALVVPSLTETGSFAIVECQMCGVRVIALNRDGIPNHIVAPSVAVENYDAQFAEIQSIKIGDDIRTRRQLSIDTRIRHSIDTWIKKVDAIAEITFFP